MTTPHFQSLHVERNSSGILTVTLQRPEVRNAFNETVIDELENVFSTLALETATRVVVLRGAGQAFCAGGDLNWMKKAIHFDFEENLADTRKLAKMFSLMNECPKPLIGVVHGAAIGGGVGLVSVCDVVLATEETVFSLSEVRLGIVPACIGPFVIAKIGASQARRFFISADRFKAHQAREIGLVHEVFGDMAALEGGLQKLLEQIVQCGPNAMAVAKKLVLDLSWPEKRESLENPLEYVAQLLAHVRISDEGQEGVKAFLDKRKPAWLIQSQG